MELLSRFNARLADLRESLDSEADYGHLHHDASRLTETAEELAGLLPRVHVLVVEHRHGTNVSVHLTFEAADQALWEYVAYWWDGEVLDAPIPDDHEEAIEMYFDRLAGREWYTLESTTLT